MSIFNRRNAAFGWVSWLVAKRVLKKKAKDAVPGTVEGSRRPNKSALAAALAGIAGALWFWRRRGDDAGSGGSDVWTPPGSDT
ncbi:MAG TPA: hypothetical protein VNT58_07985 [Gaiellaceae bacterium]|nr:hypothetical protein [Gaiellaceae bacterium]